MWTLRVTRQEFHRQARSASGGARVCFAGRLRGAASASDRMKNDESSEEFFRGVEPEARRNIPRGPPRRRYDPRGGSEDPRPLAWPVARGPKDPLPRPYDSGAAGLEYVSPADCERRERQRRVKNDESSRSFSAASSRRPGGTYLRPRRDGAAIPGAGLKTALYFATRSRRERLRGDRRGGFRASASVPDTHLDHGEGTQRRAHAPRLHAGAGLHHAAVAPDEQQVEIELHEPGVDRVRRAR